MLPLNELDVSDLHRLALDCWQLLLEHLRSALPIHFKAESPMGALWSVIRVGRTALVGRPRRTCNDSVRGYFRIPVHVTRF
jgi:hypothetical protein